MALCYKQARSEIYQLFSAELEQYAQILQVIVESMIVSDSGMTHWDQDSATSLLESFNSRHDYQSGIAFQIWSPKNELLFRSENAPKSKLSLEPNGFSMNLIENEAWHVFSSNQRKKYIIHVAQPKANLDRISQQISLQLVLIFLAGVPFLAIAIWLVLKRAFDPFNSLISKLHRRAAGNLKPLSEDAFPKEIKPVVKELNYLFKELEVAFEHERNFTSVASHELRTPLTGLLTQIQVSIKAEDEQMRNRALKKAHEAAIKMKHMIEQLLVLSRIQNNKQDMTTVPVNVSEEIELVIKDCKKQITQKNTTVYYNNVEPVYLNGNLSLVNILIRNIIENAIKYSANENSVIKIRCGQNEDGVFFTVEDNGPGIRKSEVDKINQHFFRSQKTITHAEGTGLGLSIVHRVVDLHQAQVNLKKSKIGGLYFKVIFPEKTPKPKSKTRSRSKKKKLAKA